MADVEIFVCASRKNLNDVAKLKLPSNRKVITTEVSGFEDNIDSLNPWYCEASILYDLWKNSTADIIGLEHYRRFFVSNGKILNEEQIKSKLNKNDIIACEMKLNSPTVIEGFKKGFVGFPWTKTKRCKIDWMLTDFLKHLSANEKYADVSKFMKNELNHSNAFFKGNMFIARRSAIVPWFEMMFTELESYLKSKDVKLNDSNLRSIGWLFEFLFLPWCHYAKLKIAPCNVYEYDKSLNRVDVDIHAVVHKNVIKTKKITTRKMQDDWED